jgi:arylsulfatase A-like enzyme
MTSSISEPKAGFVATLLAALKAGLLCGFLFGLVDALVATWLGTADLGVLSFLGCTAGAVLQYGLAWLAALALGAIALHPMLGRKIEGERFVAFVRIGILIGVFIEIYWWTRPYLFWGRPAFSPPRLAVTLAILAASLAIAAFTARKLATFGLRLGRAGVGIVVVSMLAGAAYIAAQRGALGDRGAKSERNQKLPNVLLVVVDALRQDTLGCYGHPLVKSPNIDRLAREGVLFENAFTQAPFTWASFGSLLTGKYPRRHGLVEMRAAVRMAPNITLPYHLKTARFRADSALAGKRLEDGDYLGATFHTGTLSTGSGLLRGFDVYYEQLAGHGVVVADSPWSVFRSDLLLNIFAAKLGQKVGGDTAGVARSWIGDHAAQRFVAMVHLYSTHTPYDSPEAFKALYRDPNYTGPVKSFYAQHREAIERGEAKPTAADVQAIRALYFAGVTEADAKIGALVDELAKRGVLDDTLVIVTADHGESLGETSAFSSAGFWEHDHMVQTNLRVPLVMRWPRGIASGVRVAALTDEIDVLPTVCDLLAIETPHEDGVYGMVDGASLLPLARGEKASVRDFSFAENGFATSVQDLRWKLVVPAGLVKAEAWEKATPDKRASSLLIDLLHDPSEQHNAFAEHPEEVARLLAPLRAWDKTMPRPKNDVQLSRRELEAMQLRLGKYGYTGEGIGAPPESNGSTPKPPAKGP